MYKIKIVNQGFSAIELMIAMIILAILIGIAMPSFKETIQNNYSTNLSNEMLKTFNYARSESKKRSTSISVCPLSLTETGCGSDWNKGWIVYIGSTDYDKNTMTLLRSYSPTGSHANITKLTSGNLITYNKFGFLSSPPATLRVYAEGCTGKNQRNVAISLTGYLDTTKLDCP